MSNTTTSETMLTIDGGQAPYRRFWRPQSYSTCMDATPIHCDESLSAKWRLIIFPTAFMETQMQSSLIDDLEGIEAKIDRAQASAHEKRMEESGGGFTIEPIAIGTIGPPGKIGRNGTKWIVPGGYNVVVTDEQAGHTFNISRSDNWPAARLGPWDDHRKLMNLAHLLKSRYVAVSHVDRGGVRHYRFHFSWPSDEVRADD